LLPVAQRGAASLWRWGWGSPLRWVQPAAAGRAPHCAPGRLGLRRPDHRLV